MQATRDEAHNSEPSPENQLNLTKYIAAVAVVLVVAVLAWFSLSTDDDSSAVVQRQEVSLPEAEPEIVVEEPIIEEPIQPVAETTTLEFTSEEPIEIELPELDASDLEVKEQLFSLTPISALAELMIDQDIIRRFVIFSDNLANQQIAVNHHLLKGPNSPFKVQQNNNSTTVDPDSFKRYDIYTDAFIAMNVTDAMELYKKYRPLVDQVFAEIGYPDDDFSDTLLIAIEHMLATPEHAADMSLQQPSVMYTYSDERLEALSDVQKQLLRMGPKNLKQIKNKLRTFKRAIEANQS